MASPLEDFLSGDPQRIWAASWATIHTRDTATLEQLRASLPAIRTATEGIDLGGLIQPNRIALDHAMTKIRGYRRWSCWCDDYPRLLSWDPRREQLSGHVCIDHETGGPPVGYTCRCLACSRTFTVTEGEQHRTWWQWR